MTAATGFTGSQQEAYLLKMIKTAAESSAIPEFFSLACHQKRTNPKMRSESQVWMGEG